MRFLTVVFASHREFLAHFSDKTAHGALFCRTKADLPPRSHVIVDVSMPGLRQPARLRGSVLSRANDKGLWIAFDRQSCATVEYLLSAGTDEALEKLSRAHSRYPARLEVSCRIDEENSASERLTGHIVDLSRGGAFVAGSSRAPLVGTRVSLDIRAISEADAVYRVDGRVAWVGKVDDYDGFGVRFDQRGAHGAAPLRALLRRASESGRLDLA